MTAMWQENNDYWHSCHWWQECHDSRITAMMILLLVLVTATTIALARAVLTDGYGTRPAPRSHHDVPSPAQRLG